MSIKLALLKSGETVISDAKELIFEEKVYGYVLENPHKISINKPIIISESEFTEMRIDNSIDVSLSPWIVLTLDKQISVPYDWVVTIIEPIKAVKELYEEKVNGKNSEVSSTES